MVIKRRVQNPIAITSSTTSGVPTLGQMTFKLSDLPAYSELNALFAQYRFKKIDLQMIPRVNAQTNSGTGYAISSTGLSYSNFHYAVDNTGPGAPSSLAVIMQYDKGKTVNAQFGKEFHISLNPRPLDVLYNGTVVSGYGVADAKTWINSTNTGVQHYGVVYGWECNYSTAATIDMIASYWIELKVVL